MKEEIRCIGEVTKNTDSLLNMIVASDCVRVKTRTPKEMTYLVVDDFSVNVNDNFPTWRKGEVVTVDLT